MFVVKRYGMSPSNGYGEVGNMSSIEVLDTTDCVVEVYRVRDFINIMSNIIGNVMGLEVYKYGAFVRGTNFYSALNKRIELKKLADWFMFIDKNKALHFKLNRNIDDNLKNTAKGLSSNITLYDSDEKVVCMVNLKQPVKTWGSSFIWAEKISTMGYRFVIEMMLTNEKSSLLKVYINLIVFSDMSIGIEEIESDENLILEYEVCDDRFKIPKSILSRLSLYN